MLGSSPSGNTAILTPLPVARSCAAGLVAPGPKSTFMTWSASGSSSGLLGSVGQTPGAAVTASGEAPTAAAIAVLLAAWLGAWTTVSGTTASTAGSVAIR